MKKFFVLAIFAFGMIGCASTGRVSALEDQVSGTRADVSASDVQNAGAFSYSSATGVFSFDASNVVAQVNGYKGTVTLDTDDINEGITNLYYTDTRARNALAAGTGVHYDSSTGTFSIGQAVETNSNVTFNDVVVSGDLTVNGTLTTINSTTVTVADKNITIADGAVNAAAANGAGLTVEGPATAATITYASADDSWNLNKKTAVTELQVDNINISGNTISSTDTNGNIILDPNDWSGEFIRFRFWLLRSRLQGR